MTSLSRSSRFQRFHLPGRRSGQGLVEFALILPVLLLLLFGIIEMARVLQAWLSVENGARFGVRYAATGDFNIDHCDEAGFALNSKYPGIGGHDQADGEVDCVVTDNEVETDALKDYARALSTVDEATGASVAILSNPVAVWDQAGYFKVSVCSTRDVDGDGLAEFQEQLPNPGAFISSSCLEDVDGTATGGQNYSVETNDAGGPGDRVIVNVDFNHPVIVPLISSVWPQLHLHARREGIVERFRTARVVGLPPASNFATDTPPPSATPTIAPTSTQSATPTQTSTSTQTATTTTTSTQSPTPTTTTTHTRTLTPTITKTFTPAPPTNTPTMTRTPTVTRTPTITWTPTATRTRTPTRTITPTRTLTPTNCPVPACTPTPSRTPSRTRTVTATRTITLTPSRTYTPGPPTDTRTATRTRTITPTITPTVPGPPPTNTPTRTPTDVVVVTTPPPPGTATPTRTRTATLVPTTPCFEGCLPTPTRTRTPTP